MLVIVILFIKQKIIYQNPQNELTYINPINQELSHCISIEEHVTRDGVFELIYVEVIPKKQKGFLLQLDSVVKKYFFCLQTRRSKKPLQDRLHVVLNGREPKWKTEMLRSMGEHNFPEKQQTDKKHNCQSDRTF